MSSDLAGSCKGSCKNGINQSCHCGVGLTRDGHLKDGHVSVRECSKDCKCDESCPFRNVQVTYKQKLAMVKATASFFSATQTVRRSDVEHI